MAPTKNKREPGSAGSKGVEFQVSLLTIFLLNALQKLTGWELSTENKRAGKFDDVVLEWSAGDTLLQAKTKQGKSRAITLRDLLSVHPNSNFGLLKYYMSYQEVKEKFKIKNVIVCANIGFDSNAMKYLKKQYACSESMLYYGDNCAFYTFTDDILPLLKENVTSYLENLKDKDKDIDGDIITEENLKDFFKYLQFYSSYPSGHRLRNVIEQILTHMKLRCRISSSDIHAKVMDWFQNKKGVHTEATAKAILSEISRDKQWETLEKYNVHFEHNDFDFLQSKKVFHVTAKGGHLLQEIKIYRALQESTVRSLYINSGDDLEVQKEAIEAFDLPDYTFLIIVFLTVKDDSVTRDMYDRLRGTLDKYYYKKVILVAADDNKWPKTFFYGNGSHHLFDGSVAFKDLTKETREGILKKKNIKFQGAYVSLETLLPTKTTDDYEKAVSRGILEKLIKNEKITVGQDLEKVSRYYINRTLVRYKEKQDEISGTSNTSIRKEAISEENFCEVRDKVILITDSAGMGKSTLLIKLAGVIKQQNPHLWVIRIELNHYTAYLRAILRNNEAVNIRKLLQSSSAAKSMNPLETFTFSLQGKVVLMFDGVDEISPDYTDLVVTSLVQCSSMPNFASVFVTARPHMTELLETKLQTKSFMLQPFTEQNQIDFLADYWSVNLGLDEEDREKCKQYAKSLISKIDKDAIFTAIPLQVRMMAEIFQEGNKLTESTDWVGCKEYLSAVDAELKLQNNLNVAKLYELFIEKKRDVFVEKSNSSGNATANQVLFDKFNESLLYHRRLALDMVLSSFQLEFFMSYTEKIEDTEAIMLKIGIVQKVDDDIHFLHRTFAEYFVADSIVQELQGHNRSVEFQRFFIEELLLDYKFNVVRAFLNNFLQQVENSLPSNSLQEYKSHKYENHWLQWQNFHLIHDIADEGHTAILHFVLKCTNFKIIRNQEIDIAELYEADTNEGIPTHIFDNTLNTLQFLLARGGLNINNENSDTPLDCAIKAGHIEMVKFLLEHGANINGKKWYRSPLYHAITYGKYDITKFLIQQGATLDWNILKTAITYPYGQIDIASYLLERFMEREEEEESKPIFAYMAAVLGQINILKDLIEGGLDINCKAKGGKSLISGAAQGQQSEVIMYLMQNGIDINSKDDEGETALQSSVYDSSKNSTAKLLVDLGIDINNKNIIKDTALHTAALIGNFGLAKLLVEHGAHINCRNHCGRTAVSEAASGGHSDILKYLIEKGGDVNITDEDGDTVFHCAAYSGDADTVTFLTTLEIDKNVRNNKGRTALHVAAEGDGQYMVDLLVGFGMDVNTRDNDGRTALHLAATKCTSTIELLVQLGVDVNIADSVGRTPLHLACKEGKWTCIDALLDNGADINVRDNYGRTPLFLAVEDAASDFGTPDSINRRERWKLDRFNNKNYSSFLRQLELVRWLVHKHDADVNVGDSAGRTPLHYAVEKDQLYIVQILVNLEAHVNARDRAGRTPLHLAADKGLSIAKFLIEYDADANIKDRKGKTAINLAIEKGHLHLLGCLKAGGAQKKKSNSHFHLQEYQKKADVRSKCRRIFCCFKYCDYGSYDLKQT